MKRIFFILTLCFAFAFIGQSQNTRVDGNANTHCFYDSDTLTNAATVTQTYSKELTYPYNYQISVVADSLSGSTAGTLQVWNKATGVDAQWVKVGSAVTIDGGLYYTPITGNVLTGSLKVTTVGSGTQSTRIRVDICTIRKSQ